MIHYKKEELHYWGQWVQPTLSAAFWSDWANNPMFAPENFPELSKNIIMLDGHTFSLKTDIKKVEQFLQKTIDNKNPIEAQQKLIKWVDEAHEYTKELWTNFPQELSEENIKKAILTLKETYPIILLPWTVFGMCDYFIEEGIKATCKKENKDSTEILANIKPLRDSFIVKQRREALALHKKHKGSLDSEQAKKEIEEHIKKFRFCGLHHFVGEPYAKKSFMEYKETETKNTKEKNTLTIEEENFSDELKSWLHLAKIAMWARTHMAETSGLVQYYTLPFLKAFNKKEGWKKEAYLEHSIHELATAVANPQQYTKPNIEERKKAVGTYREEKEHNTLKIITGEELAKNLKNLLPAEEIQDNNQQFTFPLKGLVASKGKATGKAKICITPEDIHKVQPGDILVAPETAPDFLPAMRIAAGIITNQGGITSHAAIVSREFGIPCVAGTKHATKALKDNQLVEVDAIKGEIRIIEG